MQLFTAALLGVLAPALATPPPVTTSNGFHLLLVSQDASPPARSLSMIHTGAGQSLAVAADLGSSDIVFYQNATEGGSTLATDILPQGFPMSFAFQQDSDVEGAGHVFPVDVTVSDATKGISVSEEEYDPWVVYSGGGHFFVCDQFVEYYHKDYKVLNWGSGEDGGEECERVGVIPVCEELEDLPDDAIGNHDSVEKVRCFVDDQSASQSTRS